MSGGSTEVARVARTAGSFVLGVAAGVGLAELALVGIGGDNFGGLVLATILFIIGAIVVITHGRFKAFGWGVLSVFLAAALFLLALLVIGLGMASGGDDDGDVLGPR